MVAPPSSQLSVIVPVLNESLALRNNLASFKRLASATELIFVDGGSCDGSDVFLREHDFNVLTSVKGRAIQMNAGARYSKGKHFLFLHADTRFTSDFNACIGQISASFWGFFTLALSNKDWPYSWIASSINFRSRLFRGATGDQGVFVERELFFSVGAYPEIELMEDVALSRKLRKVHTPSILPATIETSSRRWEQRGVVKTIVQMWFLQLAYKAGVAPKTLREWYQ